MVCDRLSQHYLNSDCHILSPPRFTIENIIMPATIHRPPTNPRPSRQILLQLPLEIWQDIFHFATVIPQYSYGPEALLNPMSKDNIRMDRVHLVSQAFVMSNCC